MRQHHRPVDASVEASRPHDFAVRLHAHSSRARQASTASRAQRFVTIAKRPSYRARDARKNARDLPDVTSENACDRLTRRANQAARPKLGVKTSFVIGTRSKSSRAVVLAKARTHTPRPLLRQGSGRLSANHNDRWLWVPAFAGTTGKAGGNAADRTRDKLDNRTPFFERLWPAMTTKGHTSYLRCFLDIVSPAMA